MLWVPRDAIGSPEDRGHHYSRDTSQGVFLSLVALGELWVGACTVVSPG